MFEFSVDTVALAVSSIYSITTSLNNLPFNLVQCARQLFRYLFLCGSLADDRRFRSSTINARTPEYIMWTEYALSIAGLIWCNCSWNYVSVQWLTLSRWSRLGHRPHQIQKLMRRCYCIRYSGERWITHKFRSTAFRATTEFCWNSVLATVGCQPRMTSCK